MSIFKILVEISITTYVSGWNYEISTLLSTHEPPTITSMIHNRNMTDVSLKLAPKFIIHYIRSRGYLYIMRSLKFVINIKKLINKSQSAEHKIQGNLKKTSIWKNVQIW